MRSLDILVATRMGWELADEWAVTYEEIAQSSQALSNNDTIGSRIYTSGIRVDDFRPSADIADAWRIVDKIFELEHQPVLLQFYRELHHLGGVGPSNLMCKRICIAGLRVFGASETEIQEAMNGRADDAPL